MSGPELSAVILTPDDYAAIRTTVLHLGWQTVADKIELVIVAASERELQLDQDEMSPFAGHVVLEHGPIFTSGTARAMGVAAASAPVVVFAEDHSFPDRGWAEALIDRHREPWAAVGPEIENANPHTGLSRCDFMLCFGSWAAPQPGGPVDQTVWHNSSYKRDLLLQLGDELPRLLDVEGLLLQELASRGHRHYLEPRARTRHVNISRWKSFLRCHYVNGRQYGAARSSRWSFWKRFCYGLGTPLIPIPRLRQIFRQTHRFELAELPEVIVPFCLGLAMASFGEGVAYFFGMGTANEEKCTLESHRDRHVVEGDLQVFDVSGSRIDYDLPPGSRACSPT